MSKYIIKNCPAILKVAKICDDYRTTRDNPQLCKDCTDCVLKSIKSKLDYLKCYINNDVLVNVSKMEEIIDDTLKLLGIREVE